MRNLAKLFNQSDKSGMNWYNDGHEFCKELATKYNLSLSQVCAVVSALSPGTNWEVNKRDAIGLIESYLDLRKYKHKFTTYGANVVKAQKILSGEIEPGKAFSLKTGPKTYNFYRNLLEPNNPDFCTIDRHAYTIATGETYKSLTPKQYKDIAMHYTKAAAKVGILPCQLQAVLWVDHRIKQEISFNIDVPF